MKDENTIIAIATALLLIDNKINLPHAKISYCQVEHLEENESIILNDWVDNDE